jgi:hypothetical protein
VARIESQSLGPCHHTFSCVAIGNAMDGCFSIACHLYSPFDH